MPLGRFTVRNEYGLGVKELYKEGVECEDPKAVLDGVAVAGLVGLLRQLGDLSQFAAEVFHGLQEQVASTVSRSRKLVTRVQHIEASLPSLEKAILSQTSHIHFAYSPGSEWHPRIKNEQNHFICDDLPHFIMDSYEECHEPPRLQLLDRFDKGGPGSCLQRYSDPTFFRRTSGSSVTCTKEKSQLERKIRKIKRRRSRQRSERFSSCAPTINNSERMQTSSQTAGIEPSLSHPGTTLNKSSISDREDRSESIASLNSNQSRKTKNNEVSSTVDENMADKAVQGGFACHNNVPHCSDITWDEKLEIMEHMGLNYGVEEVQNVPETDYDLHQKDIKPISVENDDQVDDFSEDQLIEPSEQDFHEHGVKTDYAKTSQEDDISEITSCTESDADVHCVRTTANEKFLDSTRRNYFYEQQVTPINMEGSKSSAIGKYPTTVLDWDVDPTTQKNNEIDEDKDFNLHEHDSVQMYSEPFPQVTNFSEGEETPYSNSLVLANSDSFHQVTEFSKDGNPPTFVVNGNFVDDSFGRKLRIGDVQYMLETIENDKCALETIKPEQVDISSAQVSEFSNGDNRLCISDGHYVHESKLEDVKLEARTIGEQYDGPLATEAVNNMNLIEWPYHDDIDSETDNFVDALNTIDSESESEYETQTKTDVEPSNSKWKLLETQSSDHLRRYDSKDRVYSKFPESSVSSHEQQGATSHEKEQEQNTQMPSTQGTDETLAKKLVDPLTSKWKLAGNESIGLMVENIKQFQLEHDFHSRMYGSSDQVYDHSEQPISLENVVSIHKSELATNQEQGVVPSFSQGIEATLTKEEVDPSVSESKQLRNASFDLVVENRNQSERQAQFHSRMYDTNDGANDGSEQEYLENAVFTHQSAANDSSEQQYLENAVSTNQSAANDSSEQEYVENAVSTHQSARETSQGLEVVPCFSHEQSVQIPPCLSIVSQGADICVKTDEIILQPAIHKPVESSSQASEDSTSVEGPFESTSSYPHALWTNGTLFGLQPSKPTVVSTSNSAPMSNGPGRIMPLSVKKSDGEDVGSLMHESHGGLDKKYMKSLDHDKLNINDSLVSGLSNGQISFQESTVPPSANLENVHSEADNTSEDRSSLLSLLARNLLNNGVRRSASLDYNEGTKPSYAGAQELVPKSNLKSTLSSPPPSPPLEHMKISFRPVDSFETSRLKLKYPERVDNHEITVETFPSFQLVPESTRFQHDMGSDSDDDTFCRSYPCVSDDSVGHVSDSDSEQWESGDTSESNDHDHDHTFYDGFRQISSTESSSSQQDLPPQLPPLPPLQWRASRPVLDEAKPDDISHLCADDTAKLKHGRQKSDTIGKQEKVAETKLYDQKQNLLTIGEKTVDDQNDFLRQIRAKSFNLKPTDAARSLQTPSLSTSNKVTAILQKASAIRKAVGSDAEDDSWSDT